MRTLVLLSALCFAKALSAQEWKVALEKNRRAEKNLGSGTVFIQETQVSSSGDSTFRNSVFQFHHNAQTKSHLYLLERGESVYFSNGEAIECYYRGMKRLEEDPFVNGFYRIRLGQCMEPLHLGYDSTVDRNLPLNYLHRNIAAGDTHYQWDPAKKIFRVWASHSQGEVVRQRFLYEYDFNDSFLLERYDYSSYTADYRRLSSESSTFSYGHLNALHYVGLRQKIDNYIKAPVLYNSRPQPIKADVTLKPGADFPNLELMDSLGNIRYLDNLPGKKVLVYVPFGRWEDRSLLSFVDSLEDAHPDWNLFLVTIQSVDDLALRQREHPNLRSYVLASTVSNMPMNGYPVWLCVDEKGVLVSENHGYSEGRKEELTKWLRKMMTD